MKFTKMHGCGNDYVYVNAFEETVTDPAQTAVRLSHRHFGIGSDGLILIKPSPEGDAEMEMYNADGSKAEMCGNGLRCVAKYVYDHGIAHQEELRLMTGAGLKSATVFPGKDGKAEKVRIDMGAPILEGRRIPTIWDDEKIINRPLTVLDRTLQITCVSMGNPHCVVYVDDVKDFPVETVGPAIETSPDFPNRINVEFVEMVSESRVIQRTWERGAGETWACGTGAAAVCVAGVLTGRTKEQLRIQLRGGELELEYKPGQSVFLTGPAEEVFTGQIDE